MVAIYSDGFDSYGTTGDVTAEITRQWTTVTNSGGLLEASTGRYTKYALTIDGAAVQQNMTPSGKHFITFNVKNPSGSSGMSNFYVRWGTNNYVNFIYDSMSSGWTLTSKINNSSTSHGLVADITGWVNIEMVLDSSGATANLLYMDEVLYMNRTQSYTAGNYVKFEADSTTGSYPWYIDDFGAWDSSGSSGNVRIGKGARVETLVPNADASPLDWTPVGQATAYQVLDNNPQVSGEYIKALTDNNVTQVAFSDLANTPVNIIGVQFKGLALNTDPTITKNLIFVMDNAGTATEVGSAAVPAATLGGKREMFTTNPITSGAWTATQINALKGGFKRKA